MKQSKIKKIIIGGKDASGVFSLAFYGVGKHFPEFYGEFSPSYSKFIVILRGTVCPSNRMAMWKKMDSIIGNRRILEVILETEDDKTFSGVFKYDTFVLTDEFIEIRMVKQYDSKLV